MSIKKYCFIVGSPRSGTTLLNKLLIAHPEIYGGPETHSLLPLSSLVNQFDFLVRVDHSQAGIHHWINRSDFIKKTKKFFESITIDNTHTEASVFLEKTPDHASCIPLIKEMYPDSTVIHMIRSPIAVCNSLIRASKGWGRDWAPSSLKRSTKMWRNFVRTACTDGRKYAGYMEIYYEELINNQRITITSILKKLDLKCNTDILDRMTDLANKYDELPKGFVSSKQAPKCNFLQEQYIKHRCKKTIEEFELNL